MMTVASSSGVLGGAPACLRAAPVVLGLWGVRKPLPCGETEPTPGLLPLGLPPVLGLAVDEGVVATAASAWAWRSSAASRSLSNTIFRSPSR